MAKRDINEDIVRFSLVNLTDGYRLKDFKCSIIEYQEFLIEHALNFQNMNISRTYLLIDKSSADIVAYMSLVSDSIRLNDTEREEQFPEYIRFGSFPSIKIGKLAVDEGYRDVYRGIGSLMIELARGIDAEVNESVACEFITVDADVENDRHLLDFYLKNSFVLNESYPHGATRKQISMRMNIFNEVDDEAQEETA
ncbi:hypothetical protein [Paenibacillus sp. PL2-23]|uniref:hypothetical protein n=1 Tax=Paenibacillus sp. PL2-23 TaxID=2100729 RepID=UPI0030FA28E8